MLGGLRVSGVGQGGLCHDHLLVWYAYVCLRCFVWRRLWSYGGSLSESRKAPPEPTLRLDALFLMTTLRGPHPGTGVTGLTVSEGVAPGTGAKGT
ncbi:hypothetical protein ATCC27039_07730 [Actinomyces naeslundii]|nr:hypothetical protein ATCC27039_07730 [Actinomyces naeslundii]